MAIKIIDLAGVKEKGRASFERLKEVLGWVEGSRQGWGRGVGAGGNEFFAKTVHKEVLHLTRPPSNAEGWAGLGWAGLGWAGLAWAGQG